MLRQNQGHLIRNSFHDSKPLSMEQRAFLTLCGSFSKPSKSIVSSANKTTEPEETPNFDYCVFYRVVDDEQSA